MKIQKVKSQLKLNKKSLYAAGQPGYMRNFSRDSLIYGLLAGDKEALLAQIEYSAKHQGKTTDPETGEEPGKIHHELPAGEWRGRPTTYNACDTTALFLLSIAALVKSGQKDLLNTYRTEIDLALTYTKSHLTGNLFLEDPTLSGASNFAVRVTYWKDSILGAKYEEPHYPIVYSLVNFQYASALKFLSEIKEDTKLLKLSKKMKQTGIEKLWRNNHFLTALDDIEIDHPSSDSLHILLYLEPEELPQGYADKIEKYSEALMTKSGYMSGIVGYESDDYHTKYVWVFEQALLHAAAKKHKLTNAMKITERVQDFMGEGFPELIDTSNDHKPAGNNPQLWSIGAYQYFNNPENSYINFI